MNIAIASSKLNTNNSSSITIDGKKLIGVTKIIIEGGQATLINIEILKINEQGKFYIEEESEGFAKYEFTLVCDRLDISGHAIGFDHGTDMSQLPQELQSTKGE
jgi:hypothetical protein